MLDGLVPLAQYSTSVSSIFEFELDDVNHYGYNYPVPILHILNMYVQYLPKKICCTFLLFGFLYTLLYDVC